MTDNDKKFPRVYISSDNTADFICPVCDKHKTLDVSKYKNIRRSVLLKYKCQCGHSFSVFLERRQGGHRKETDLFGTYKCFFWGQGARTGRMVVIDVSLSGMRFKLRQTDSNIIQHSPSTGTEEFVGTKGPTDADLNVDDTVWAEFHLDDRKKSLIKQETMIRWINDPYVGVEFTSKNSDSVLGFYMRN